jgi:hypothetical protein
MNKVFIGKVKEHTFSNGNKVFKLGLTAEDLDKLRDNLDNCWVNVQIAHGKSGSPYAEIDQWKPTGAKPQPNITGRLAAEKAREEQSDLPF